VNEVESEVGRGGWWLIVGIVWWAGVGTVAAQSGDEVGERSGEQRSGDRVLHEYLDEGPVSGSRGSGNGVSGEGEASSGGGETAGDRSGDVPTRRSTEADRTPGLTMDAGRGEVIFGPEGPAEGEVDRSPYGGLNPGGPATRLDEETDRVGELNYHAVFQPSVFPYKRVVSQNQPVREGEDEYGLSTRRGQLERVQVSAGRGNREGVDTFWGSVLIRAEEGTLHPIPSVAPNQRVLAIESEPSVDWRVLRDEAGNFYLRGGHRGRVRVNMKVAVPAFYFSGEFGGLGDGGWERFPAVGGERESMRDAASRVVEAIGVSREQSPSAVIEDLIYHFRDFETKALPERLRSGDRYYNIATSQIGVCRHRSLAFVITARHLGIPARYLFNEAHAFVEVYWPEGGWRRIDLGGAARDIGYSGGSSDSVHARSSEDPLPQPPAYRRELERLERLQGGSDDDGGEGQSSGGEQRAGTGSDGSGNVNTESEGEDGSSRSQRESPAGERGERMNIGDSASGGSEERRRASGDEPVASESGGESGEPEMESVEQLQSGGASSGDGRDDSQGRPTRLTIRADGASVYRGEQLTVRGRLTSEGEPVAGREVVILFGASGETEAEQMQRVGSAQTGQDGRYAVEVQIPKESKIGRWQLQARFGGTEALAGAVAR